jgi:hypothetical protein
MNTFCKSGIVALLALTAVAWAGQDKGPRATHWPILHSEPVACSPLAWHHPCVPRSTLGHPGGNLLFMLMDDAF